MANAFAHIELRTPALERAKQFYSSLLDWTLTDVPMGDMTYTSIDAGDGVGGGMLSSDPSDAARWLPFLNVDDLPSTLDRALDLGASIVQPETLIPGDGTFAVLADPTGALVGLIQHSGST